MRPHVGRHQLTPVDHPAARRFELPVEGGAAFAAYELAPGVMTITHVVVPDAARGAGVAGRLTEHALAQARARGLRVVPACPFARDYVAQHPEHADLIA